MTCNEVNTTCKIEYSIAELPDSLEPLSRRPRGVRSEEDLFSPDGLLRSLYGVIL